MSDTTPSTTCVFPCGAPVPPELATERMCVLHFTLCVERSCAEMRRESASGRLTSARQAHITRGLGGYAATLASVGTGTQRLSDELKRRILSTFLTVMVMRESLYRSAESEVAKYSSTAHLSRTA
jgi:hypothetical protein